MSQVAAVDGNFLNMFQLKFYDKKVTKKLENAEQFLPFRVSGSVEFCSRFAGSCNIKISQLLHLCLNELLKKLVKLKSDSKAVFLMQGMEKCAKNSL